MDSPKRSIWKVEEGEKEENAHFFDNISPGTPGKKNRMAGRTSRDGVPENEGGAAVGSAPWTPMASINTLFSENIGHCATPTIGDFNIFVDTILSPMAMANQSSNLNINAHVGARSSKPEEIFPSSKEWGVQYSRTDIASIPSGFCFSEIVPPRVGVNLPLKKKIPMNLATFDTSNGHDAMGGIVGVGEAGDTSKAREVFAARLRTGSTFAEDEMDVRSQTGNFIFATNGSIDPRLQDFNMSLSPGTPESAIRNRYRESSGSRLFSPLHSWPYAATSSSSERAQRLPRSLLSMNALNPADLQRDSALRLAEAEAERRGKSGRALARTSSSSSGTAGTAIDDKVKVMALLSAGQSLGGIKFSPHSDGADNNNNNNNSGSSGRTRKTKKSASSEVSSGKLKRVSSGSKTTAAGKLKTGEYEGVPVAGVGSKGGARASPSAKVRAASPVAGDANKPPSPNTSSGKSIKPKAPRSSKTSPAWNRDDDIVICNCVKSRCLKLYCDCFRFSRYCHNACRCSQCVNRPQSDVERSAAIAAIIERNPDAFVPRIVDESDAKKHLTGCHCKRTGCLKKYCECFTGQAPCNQRCRCVGCKNTLEAYGETPDLLRSTDPDSSALSASVLGMLDNNHGDTTLNSSCESADSIDALGALAFATPPDDGDVSMASLAVPTRRSGTPQSSSSSSSSATAAARSTNGEDGLQLSPNRNPSPRAGDVVDPKCPSSPAPRVFINHSSNNNNSSSSSSSSNNYSNSYASQSGQRRLHNPTHTIGHPPPRNLFAGHTEAGLTPHIISTAAAENKANTTQRTYPGANTTQRTESLLDLAQVSVESHAQEDLSRRTLPVSQAAPSSSHRELKKVAEPFPSPLPAQIDPAPVTVASQAITAVGFDAPEMEGEDEEKGAEATAAKSIGGKGGSNRRTVDKVDRTKRPSSGSHKAEAPSVPTRSSRRSSRGDGAT